MFTLIILDCINKLSLDRSISGIYHMLTGKKSVQSIQDAHIFQLTAYFGIYKRLDFAEFERIITVLEREQFIAVSDNYSAVLTDKGKQYVTDKQEILNQVGLKGLKYHRMSEQFLLRLQLFCQTATNLFAGNNSFLAITDNREVQLWVKHFYHETKPDLRKCLDEMYKELKIFLSQIDQRSAELFVDRLTGFKRIALSKEQLSKKYKKSIHEIEVQLTDIVHRLIAFILNNKQVTPFLVSFVDDLKSQMFLTDSASHTYRLYQKGLSIAEIASTRGLKQNTIQDHIIEISYIFPELILPSFLNKEAIETIKSAMNQTNSKRLKDIKALVGDNYSYFDIRLVVAVNQMDK
ncbi:helix-turn-helix domain-containing protein [Aquibacillus salsiterrae]|uniref:Helix-turn-helix domain-containing protein n=1 Tax=Aquibacillus salsiterrae TaxID=2950439 RepID=A0A9X3WCH8_9BACI|nr:helix-turn-helix domain-containing protein [Aquibacillus salsiterrae]MDC3415410.1 helix-turn-helix domain-containing protein [Aquibacillus salsiterrae]